MIRYQSCSLYTTLFLVLSRRNLCVRINFAILILMCREIIFLIRVFREWHLRFVDTLVRCSQRDKGLSVYVNQLSVVPLFNPCVEFLAIQEEWFVISLHNHKHSTEHMECRLVNDGPKALDKRMIQITNQFMYLDSIIQNDSDVMYQP